MLCYSKHQYNIFLLLYFDNIEIFQSLSIIINFIFDKIIESNVNGTLIEVQIGVNVIYRRSILPRNYN